MKQALSEQLEVEVGQAAGYPCIRIEGEGEPLGARRLEQALAELMAAGHTRIVLDTRDVRFLDPACCEAVKSAAEQLEEEGGCLLIVDQSLPLERALKLLGLDKVTQVFPTISQAARYFAAHC